MEILKYDKETVNDLIKRSQADINEILNIVSDIEILLKSCLFFYL